MGDCYKDAWKTLSGLGKGTLVHGTVLGGYPLRSTEHAWIELGDEVYEPHSAEFMDRKEFYKGFKAKAGRKYGFEEAMVMLLKQGNYGPWF